MKHLKKKDEKITAEQLAITINKLAATVDNLTIAVKNGFDDVDKRFNTVEKRLDTLDRGQEDIKLRLDNGVFRFELIELQKRVEILKKNLRANNNKIINFYFRCLKKSFFST